MTTFSTQQEAYQDGYDKAKRGLTFSSCPYSDSLLSSWMDGYNDAKNGLSKALKGEEDFFKEFPYYERKPIESKPALSLKNWNLFAYRGYEMASGVMASDGHPYIRKGSFVEHTSVIFNKTVEEDGTIVCETVNSVYKLAGPKWEPKSIDFLYLTEDTSES